MSYHQSNKAFLISNLFDNFDVENDVAIKELIDYNFEEIQNPSQYYEECIWKIREEYLKDKIKQYTKQIDTQADNTKRLKKLKKINEIQKKLKNKNLED